MTERHAHRCKYGMAQCGEGPCECACGAVLVMGPAYQKDHRFAWKLPDGSYAPFPDPNEAAGIETAQERG